jgi:hypothetical protein
MADSALEMPSRYRVSLVLLIALLLPGVVIAQTETARPRESPTALVAVLSVALYTAQTNAQEPPDSTKAATLQRGEVTTDFPGPE